MSLDAYYSANPVEVFDRNQWDVYDAILATGFHKAAFWSPMLQYVDLKASPEKNTVTAFEALPGMVNANPIGTRQLYVDPMTWGSRNKKLTGHKHYGQKVQMHDLDPLLNQWIEGGISKEQLLMSVAAQQLGYSVVWTMEHIARNQFLRRALHQFYGPQGQGSSFADIGRDTQSTFQLSMLGQIKLRLSARVQATMQQYGTYLQPIPGKAGQLLAMTTPGVIHDLWNQKNDFMVDLRTLRDPRLLVRGSQIDYKGFTFAEGPWDVSALWNSGMVDAQALVYKYLSTDTNFVATRGTDSGIVANDGAPDPEVRAVDGYQYVGLGSDKAMHYILVSQLAAGTIVPGERVTLHTVQTLPSGTLGYDYFGINYGVAWYDGMTHTLEVESVENVTESGDALTKITFRTPVLLDYTTEIAASGASVPIADSANGTTTTITADRSVVAFLTKAQHIHPVVINAARGAHVFAMTQKVKFHEPVPVDDFEAMWRMSWNMRGAPNVWNPDLYEVYFCAGSFGNRAAALTF